MSIFNKFKNFLSGFSKPSGVKNFGEDQKTEEAFDTKERGIKEAPLNQIIGSVGRYLDFDCEFRLKQHLPSDRLESVRRAMVEGKPLPPVKLYQIKELLFGIL